MPGRHGTDAVTRVLIETSDHEREWTTVGVHGNVIEASWLALHDAVRYGLLRHDRTGLISGERSGRCDGDGRSAVEHARRRSRARTARPAPSWAHAASATCSSFGSCS